jgi:hypothetical protein
MMIVQIRGTGGSGKTWVMRQVMKAVGKWKPVWVGPDHPARYINNHVVGYTNGHMALLGNYESADGGGIDNLRARRFIESALGGFRVALGLAKSHTYQNVGEEIGNGEMLFKFVNCIGESGKIDVILCEGLLLGEDVTWTAKMKGDVRILFLNTPLDRCLRQTEERRKARGNLKPLSTKKTTERQVAIERVRKRLELQGKKCYPCSAPQAVRIILKLLNQGN